MAYFLTKIKRIISIFDKDFLNYNQVMFIKIPFQLNKKLNLIKLVVMDFDGVLTDGGIYLGNENFSFRKFNTKDGMGIKILQSLSIELNYIWI